MQQEYNDKKDQDKKNSSPEKILPQQHDEDFNTDSDKPSSDVGPGYDDTGLGNDAQSSLKNELVDPSRRQRKKIQNKQERKN